MFYRVASGPVFLFLFWIGGPDWAARASESVKINPLPSLWECNGTCALTLIGGPLIEINMTPNTDSWFVGGSFSHAFVEFRDQAAIEGEVGLGKRYGQMHAWETWAAAAFRWKSFPWNRYIVTTVAMSVGLSYADSIDRYEINQSTVGYGNRLLFYVCPEITFAWPSRPDWELAVQIHHRSGGGILWGYNSISKGVWGASQFLVAGIRHRF